MTTKWFPLLCLDIVCFEPTALVAAKNIENAMNLIYEWKYLDYNYPNDSARQIAVQRGAYDYRNCFPMDMDRWHGKTFVTVLRRNGVPSSLNIVSENRGPGGPLLTPYPDWSWASTDNCDNIVEVYHVTIDECDRLWVLDTGLINDKAWCPPKLLAFNLHTSQLVHKVLIPNSVVKNSTSGEGMLVSPVMKTSTCECEQFHVYLSDFRGYGLIVYNGKSFRRLTSSTFLYDPKATYYSILGESVYLEYGVASMALSQRTKNLYYGATSSFSLAYVNTNAIDEPYSNNGMYYIARDILRTQATAKAMSKTGVLFFGLVNDTSIGCWNEDTTLERRNIDAVARNSNTLQTVSGIKIEGEPSSEILWALSNRYQKVLRGTLNFNEPSDTFANRSCQNKRALFQALNQQSKTIKKCTYSAIHVGMQVHGCRTRGCMGRTMGV